MNWNKQFKSLGICKAKSGFWRRNGFLLLLALLFLSGFISNTKKQLEFASVDIGNPIAGKTTIVKPGKDYDIVGYGTMFGLHVASDMGRFVYVRMKGDFDISVQIESIHPDNPSNSKGGLMVRKDLSPGSIFFSQEVTTNEYTGECDRYTCIYRLKEGGKWDGRMLNEKFGYATSSCGTIPNCSSIKRPFPKVWLRIRKTGNDYTAYYKDGDQPWKETSGCGVGKANLDLGEEPFVGMYIGANEHGLGPENGVLVKFRDLQGFR